MTVHDDRLAALATTHQRLFEVVDALGPEGVAGPSYCREWSIAQLLSHLGAGAEIFGGYLGAALEGGEPPDQASFPAVWDRWNALGAAEVMAAAREADAAFTARLQAVTPEQLESARVAMFGQSMGPVEITGMRMSELGVHTWDVVVMTDPGATIAPDAALGIVDGVEIMGPLVGRPVAALEVAVTTTDPERAFRLSVGDVVELAPEAERAGQAPAEARLRLPAESLVRLVYGRLDPDHTPDTVVTEGVELELLRQVFPGF